MARAATGLTQAQPQQAPDLIQQVAHELAQIRMASSSPAAGTPLASTPAGTTEAVPWGRAWLKAADILSLPCLQRKASLQ